MKVRYDSEADALYLRLADAPVTESEEVRPGIVLDFDAAGGVVAIEILDTKDHLAAGADLAQLTAA
ncbi:DUF2283 domain-containing protein [Methylobacterium sp. ARG-1]|uniref:DUF2283 domain-containing protein n=1 Tax=Methylobacterium sp. ARG-1 TaxID=1692501 RepID=UPI0006818393|nr:DUF2283 domain-containing protein [Methylobacterium sp. ARG-1]KNY19481.1 hypothetical protein AKJ13_27385 [Methylobacterium sp. ARG-1]